MSSRLVHACLVAILASCGSPAASPPPPTTVEAPPSAAGGRVVDGWFVPDGFAASPRACTAASDCAGNTLPDPEQPCCQVPTSMGAYSTAYWEALGAWRNAHCAAVTCPAPPPPAMPSSCRFEMQCTNGTCADTCDVPPAHAGGQS